MTTKLDPEAKRLRRLTDGQLVDEIGELDERHEALKAEAIRRELRRAEGALFKITLTPPGTSQRTDKKKLLEVLGMSEGEYSARFCYAVHTGWRLTCTALRKLAAAA